eukprot:scaffold952_cov409-Prasinococcus_capsulatus_cf.AAC.55
MTHATTVPHKAARPPGRVEGCAPPRHRSSWKKSACLGRDAAGHRARQSRPVLRSLRLARDTGHTVTARTAPAAAS